MSVRELCCDTPDSCRGEIREHVITRDREGRLYRTCMFCQTTTPLEPRKTGRPPRNETALIEAWEDLVAMLDTLLENARDDYDQSKPMSRARVRQIDSAYQKARDQRSRFWRQGIMFEGGDG